MNASQLISLRNRTPFEPLEIHLNDGAKIRLEKPYHLATRLNSPTCWIYEEQGRVRIVAYRNITEIVTVAAQS